MRYADASFEEHIGIKKKMVGVSERIVAAETSPIRIRHQPLAAKKNPAPPSRVVILPKLNRSELIHESKLDRSLRQAIIVPKMEAMTAEISESL